MGRRWRRRAHRDRQVAWRGGPHWVEYNDIGYISAHFDWIHKWISYRRHKYLTGRTLKDVGHFLMLEAPEKWAKIISEFVRKASTNTWYNIIRHSNHMVFKSRWQRSWENFHEPGSQIVVKSGPVVDFGPKLTHEAFSGPFVLKNPPKRGFKGRIFGFFKKRIFHRKGPQDGSRTHPKGS